MSTVDERRDETAARAASPEGGCPMKALGEAPYMGGVALDREDPGFLARAFETYAGMREQAAVVRAPFAQNPLSALSSIGETPQAPDATRDRLFVTRYDEAVSVLLDDRVSSDFRALMTEEQRGYLAHMPEELKPIAHSLILLDPPEHTRLRKLVQPSFAPRAMEALRPRVQRIADALLDRAEREAEARSEAPNERSMELVHAFAYPMPVKVISDMLGIPAEDREEVHRWAEGLLEADMPSLRDERRRSALRDFNRYLEGLFERKRRAPGDDMITQMLQAEEDGDRLNHQEMVSMVFILFFAGHITTVNLIGNAVVALLTHPEQRDRLLADPSLVKGAVEETLRYWGPVDYMSTPRVVTKDMEVAGTRVARGEQLSVGLASANRDPARFVNPDVFDIARPDANRNVAFGKGIHLCLGAPLARLEGEIALETLFRRYPKLRLAVPAEELKLGAVAGLRGFRRVPLLF